MNPDEDRSMQQLNRLASIGTLSAGIAHEIKNALVPVKTFVDLLRKEHPQAELADVVNRELRRIDSLVSQMLRFAGPAKPTFGSIRIHEVLDHCLRLFQYQIEGKKIGLERAFAAAPDIVQGDSYQLEQAFTNVLLNGVEAMKPGGRLSLSTDNVPPGSAEHSLPSAASQALVRIRIHDTGLGVPPENLKKLFDTFFTTKPGGTGLGLTITRRIIQEHHGAISAESELGKGTTFIILLPAP